MKYRYMTASEVAEMFRLNVETVYDLIARGGMPATKLGGSWRFEESELHDWFRSRRNTGPSRHDRTSSRRDRRRAT